jgi:hypothetical protein
MGNVDSNNMNDTSGYEKSDVWLACDDLTNLRSVVLPNWSEHTPAILGMVNWLSNRILLSLSFSWSYPNILSSPWFSSTTLPSHVKPNLPYPTLRQQARILSDNQIQYRPGTAYTEYCKHWVHHQQHAIGPEATLITQTLRATSPVHLCPSKCCHTPLELCIVLADCARWFPGAPECTCS